MKGICFLCGNYETLEEHHIFGGARRSISTKYGLTVHLCPWCHRIDADSAHRSGKTAELLHQYGQHKAMTEQNWSREEFIAHFGKNYLDEAQIWGSSTRTTAGTMKVPFSSWRKGRCCRFERRIHLLSDAVQVSFRQCERV